MTQAGLDVAIHGTLSDAGWSNKHSHTCPDANEKMHKLERHAYDLGDLVCRSAYDFDELSSYSDLGDLLKVIGGIHEVAVDCARYDTSIFMCHGAAEYEEQHSEVVSQFATKLVRLLLLFNAFENVCDLAGVRRSREGIGVDAARFLSNNFERTALPKHVECIVGRLFCTINRWLRGDQATLVRWETTTPRLYGFPLALVVVARLRNRLTHDLLTFPQTSTKSDRIEDAVLLEAGRVVLFAIQMLIRAALSDPHSPLERGYETETTIGSAFVSVHLEDFDA